MASSAVSLPLVLLGLLLLFLVVAKRQRRMIPRLPHKPLRRASADQLRTLQKTGHYRGVRIEPHCAASSQLKDQVFRFHQIPDLPLTGCDATVCRCAYVGLLERRTRPERRCGIDRRASARDAGPDRRSKRPRRKMDRLETGANR